MTDLIRIKDLLERLRAEMDSSPVDDVSTISRSELDSLATALEAAHTRIAELEARLEIPEPPFQAYDGIECRDETIRLLDAKLDASEKTREMAATSGAFWSSRAENAEKRAEEAEAKAAAADARLAKLQSLSWIAAEIDAAVATEREACAKVAEERFALPDDGLPERATDPQRLAQRNAGRIIATAIRARETLGGGNG